MTTQRPPFALLLALLGVSVSMVAVAPALGQSWSGALALGVEVENEAGQPMPGARVEVQYAETDAYDGPDAVTTDDAGRATFYGLAEGLWRIRVERESYSGYMSVIRLDRSKKKVQITAGPLRDASAPPLTVSFRKSVGERLAPDAPETREDDGRRDRRSRRDRAADRRSERDRKRAEKEEQRRADARARGERVEPRVDPEPELRPDPTPPAVTRPATPQPPPEPKPMPEPAPPADPKPEVMPETMPQPEPVRPPVPPTDPEPDATPEPVPQPARPVTPPVAHPVTETLPEPTAPSLPPSPVRSGSTGSCADCKPGESAVSARVESAPLAAGSTAGCPAGLGAEVRRAVRALAAAPSSRADSYAGPLTAGGALLPWAEGDAQAEAAAILAPYLGPASTCRVALVVLPPSSRFAGYRYTAADAQADGDCLAGEDCPIGDSRWDDHPRIEKTDAGTFIYSVFENRSRRWDRRGEMSVYFRNRR